MDRGSARVGSSPVVSRVRSLILPEEEARVRAPGQRLVIEPRQHAVEGIMNSHE